MSHLRGFKQKLAVVSRLWEEKDYDTALAEVESLLKIWPGNAHLHILWASPVQLQEDPKHDLDEAKQALQRAVEFDKGSPAAAIELGHFLDNVEDDPHAASKAYAEGVAAARHLLIDGLIGQAKVFRQLDKREEFRRCLLEILHLARFERGPKRTKAAESGADIIFESPKGHFHAIQLTGPYAEQIQDLLSEGVPDLPA
jgi:tetratricopeptide (TPR) repeat protein